MANGPYYGVGTYVVEIIEQALGKTGKGTPQFILRFRVLGEPSEHSYTPAPQLYERTAYFYLTEAAAPRVRQDLEKLGFTGGSVTRLDPSHPDHQSFVGHQVEMYCKHEADLYGNPREKWQMSRGVSGGIKVEPLEAAEKRQLDALFGKSASKPAAPVRSSHPVAAAVADAEITDDDIPF